jgi:hypothetical protein
MSYTKIFTSVLFLSSFSLFAQVQEPVKNDKKANTSNAKPMKPSQTSGAKALKVAKPAVSAGQRAGKSTQTK